MKKETIEKLERKLGTLLSIIGLVISIIAISYTRDIERGNRVAETYADAIVSLEKISFYYFIGSETGDYSLEFIDEKKINDEFVFEHLEECVNIKATLEVLGKEEYAEKYWEVVSSIYSDEHIYDGKKVEELIGLFREDLK